MTMEQRSWELTYNLILCGVSFPLLAYFFNKWIKALEAKITEFCRQNREDHKELFSLASKNEHRITVLETLAKAEE